MLKYKNNDRILFSSVGEEQRANGVAIRHMYIPPSSLRINYARYLQNELRKIKNTNSEQTMASYHFFPRIHPLSLSLLPGLYIGRFFPWSSRNAITLQRQLTNLINCLSLRVGMISFPVIKSFIATNYQNEIAIQHFETISKFSWRQVSSFLFFSFFSFFFTIFQVSLFFPSFPRYSHVAEEIAKEHTHAYTCTHLFNDRISGWRTVHVRNAVF